MAFVSAQQAKLNLSVPKAMGFNAFVKSEMDAMSDADLEKLSTQQDGIVSYIRFIERRNRKRFTAQNVDAQGSELSASAKQVEDARRCELLKALATRVNALKAKM